MSVPKFSVIIPVYNGADYLDEAIQSVLDQTYADFELVIVSDASSDNSSEVIRGFDDPRIKFIEHEENRGANAARNTGIRFSTGEVLAFLDQDDTFHPEKIQAHVDYFQAHPDIGVTYNSHFELNYSSETIREIFRPPQLVTLTDLVLGFPIPPSDMVITRDWAYQDGFWDETHGFYGGEYILLSRLFLSGCKFGFVNRALNYRRHHSGRIYRELSGGWESELGAQEKVFSDPLCPPEVLGVRDLAYLNTYLEWASLALAQDETALGQAYLQEAVRLNPTIIEGKPCPLALSLVTYSIADETQDHEAFLQRIFAQLPPAMAAVKDQYEWVVSRGYLLKGTRAIMWDRPEDGRIHFARAVAMRAEMDENFFQRLIYHLRSYEIEFGPKATQAVLHNLSPYLEKAGSRGSVRRLWGSYLVNQAFQSYQDGQTAEVSGQVIRAVANDPKYLANRGVLSILFRSAFGLRSS